MDKIDKAIREISFDCLLPDAERFVAGFNTAADEKIITKGQLHGAINILKGSGYFGKLAEFISHQKDRDWGTRSQYIGDFYTKLQSYFNSRFDELMNQFDLWKLGNIPEGDSRSERKQRREFEESVNAKLAGEFLKHLLAEIQYKDKAK